MRSLRNGLYIRYNKTCLYLGICLILYMQGFYLLPEYISVGKTIYLHDIANVMLIAYIVIFYIRHLSIIRDRKDGFQLLSFLFPVIILIAVLMAYIHWGQNFITSFMPQRYLFIIMLSYYPIKMAVEKEKVSGEQLLEMILTLAKIQLAIMMVQFVLQFGGITILQCDISEREFLAFPRYYIDALQVLFLMFYEISAFFEGRGKGIWPLIWIGGSVIFFICMAQGRMALIGICVALLAYYLTLKTTKQKKIFVTIVFVIAAIFLFNTTLFQDTINLQDSGRDTTTIRVEGVAHYLLQLKNSPIFGRGSYPNSTIANIERGYYENFYMNDNGIFGLAYMYGLVGVLWVVMMFAQMIKKGFKIKSRGLGSGFLMLGVFLIAVCTTLANWYWIDESAFFIVLLWVVMYDFTAERKTGIIDDELEND